MNNNRDVNNINNLYLYTYLVLLNIFSTNISQVDIFTIREVRCGITTQLEKSKKMTIVNFMECDLNQLF